MATIAASILSADPLHLAEAARRVVACGADALHLNVIGSEYRPNLTLGHFVCAALRPHVQVPVHARRLACGPGITAPRMPGAA